MSASQIIAWAVLGFLIWFFTRHWTSDDKFMLVLWLIVMGWITYVVGCENISIGFPQGDL